MRRTICALSALCLLSVGRLAEAGPEDVVISEFLAVNDSSARDEDGDTSDYIEIFNAGETAVSLSGWYLTDNGLDPTQWRFPNVSIPGQSFLIVWASGKDRRDPAGELHTNFRLAATPSYLGLVAADGATEMFAYAPYPDQVSDFSYGLDQNASITRLVSTGDSARALVPADGGLGTTWRQRTFNDSGWSSGNTGVGYDRNAEYQPLIDLDVRAQMEDTNTSCYIRVPFNVADPTGITGMVLRMKYDDGFVAFVNGTQVTSSNAPGSLSWNSSATQLNDDGNAVVFEDFVLTGTSGLLVAGQNVLAIHGLNDNLNSSDFVMLPELDALNAGELDRETVLYFPQPTPGSGNLSGVPGVVLAPTVIPTSRVFTGSVSVQMGTASEDGTIRYTTDGSIPTESSTAYAGAFSVTSSQQIRARVFEPDGSLSPVKSTSYIRLASDAQSFQSELPVVIVDNFDGGSVPSNGFQPCFLAIYEPQAGTTRLSGAPALQSRAGIRIRGSSTQNRPKKAYAFEFWDEKNEDIDLAPLGLPAESDWILYGAYNFDHAHIRNAFIYEMSNQVGRYATRTRFCEVFVNTGGGSLANADYVGIYTFMEKIKRGDDRVDVEKLTASVVSEPDITGGYMLKIDRADPGDSGFNAGGRTLRWVYPKEEEVTGLQQNWIQDYFNDFNAALQGPNYRDPVNGYRRYIDDASWVDHHILNVLPKNVDALRLSTYFYKTRGGKIEFGPIWDFDRSMNSTDGRDDNPSTWEGTGDGTRYFEYPWWERLFDDVDFWQLWKDRWHHFRQAELSEANMRNVIDGMADEIRSAVPRDVARWNQTSVNGWQSNINSLKNWLGTRGRWIDSQFAPVPVLSRTPGQIAAGTTLTMSTSTGSIYYTLDGSDPRARGGGIAAGAIRYTGALTLNETVEIVARTRISTSDWSADTGGSYYTEIPPIVVSEVFYHPDDPPLDSPFNDDDFEWLELENIGNEAIDLEGFELASGIEFTFGPLTIQPGEFVVIVEDLAAFSSRYDTSEIDVAGVYARKLDNSGDRITLLGSLGEPILDFAYSDVWYPSTDGLGDSLVIVDSLAPRETWSEQESWMPSSTIGGTPGFADGSGPTGGRQLPGDANQDGRIDISDAFSLLRRLFLGDAGPLPCEGASFDVGGNLVVFDVNGDAGVDISDVSGLLSFLFQGGQAPMAGLECRRVEGCPSACGF